MALHLLGFKLGTLLLSLFGVERSLAAEEAPAEGSFPLFCYYLFMGVAFPLLFIRCFRWVRGLMVPGARE